MRRKKSREVSVIVVAQQESVLVSLANLTCSPIRIERF